MKAANQFWVFAIVTMLACSLGCEQTNAQVANTTETNVSKVQDKQNQQTTTAAVKTTAEENKAAKEDPKMEIATFGAGCFWCVEAVFQELKGVQTVKSGYTGGKVANPTYRQICTGNTGHAEVCRIEFDPNQIKFKELLEVFWKTHDPTTLNQQGNDRGTQYRSAIFYHNDEQKSEAEKYKKILNDSGAFRGPIVTEIAQAGKFYDAEKYHDNYFKDNPNAGYCRVVIQPKMDKFRKAFADKIKSDK